MGHRRPTGLVVDPRVPVLTGGDPINKGLIGAWMLSDGGGAKLRDLTGHSNGSITAYASSMWVPGPNKAGGRALQFNGSTQYATLTAPLASLATASWSFWVFQPARAGGWTPWVNDATNFIAGFYFGKYNDAQLQVYADNQVVPGPPAYTAGAWQHIVGVFYPDPNNAGLSIMTAYVNGVNQGLTGVPLASLPASNNVQLAANTSNSYYSNCTLSNLRMWNRALAAAEVRRLYQQPFAGLAVPKRLTARAGVAAAQNPYAEPPFLSAWYATDPLPTLPSHRPQGAGPTTNTPLVWPWLTTVLSAWQPADPPPTLPQKLGQGAQSFTGLPLSGAYAYVQTDVSLPVLPPKLPQGAGPTTNTPYAPVWFSAVETAWQPPDPPPTLTAKLIQPGAPAFVPGAKPFVPPAPVADPLPTMPTRAPQGAGPTTSGAYTQPWLSAVLSSWQPPDPLPTLPTRTPQGAGPTTSGAYTRPWLATTVGAWQPPDPLPTLPIHLPQGFVPNPVGYTRPWLSAVLSSWQPPDPLPTLTAKLVQSAGPTTNTPYAPAWLSAVETAWVPPDPLPTLPIHLPQAFVPNPVGYTRPWLSPIIQAWQPPDPLPTLTAKLVQSAGPATNGAYVAQQLAALAAWQTADPLPTLATKLPQGAPPAQVPYAPQQLAALAAWQPADPAPTLPRYAPQTSLVVRTAPWLPAVLQSWGTADPLPTLTPKLPQAAPQGFVPGARPYVPPPVADTPLPVLRPPLPQGAGPAANTYQPRPWQDAVLRAWQPPDPLPTLTAKLIQPFIPPVVSPYTPNSRTWQDAIVAAWQPPDPLPQGSYRSPFPQGLVPLTPFVLWYVYQEGPPMFRNQPDEWWPQLVPSTEYADFSYDATDDLAPGDYIVGLSAQVSPSGPGEVAMSRLTLMNTPAGVPALITVWLTGGVAGRTYLYEIVITTAELRTIPILIGQRCSPVLPFIPIPPPPNPGFGSAITWP